MISVIIMSTKKTITAIYREWRNHLGARSLNARMVISTPIPIL
jgi:hypothetical protein